MQNSEWLNYHHLYYFWNTAKEGSLTRAAERLRLSHSTLSSQIRMLEDFLGGELFLRTGRAISLTLPGRDVLAYADDIFRAGTELVEMARGKQSTSRTVLRVGIVGSMPKSIAYRLLAPVLSADGAGPIHLRQDGFQRLLDELAAGHLHLVLSNLLPPEGMAVNLFAHLLEESRVSLYGAPPLFQKYSGGFPQCLQDAPMLLPAAGSRLRRLLDQWLVEHNLRVTIKGEFDDAAMMQAFGAQGHGLFPVQSVLAAEVEQSSTARTLGECVGVSEQFYAISTERRVRRAELRSLIKPAPRGRPRA